MKRWMAVDLEQSAQATEVKAKASSHLQSVGTVSAVVWMHTPRYDRGRLGSGRQLISYFFHFNHGDN